MFHEQAEKTRKTKLMVHIQKSKKENQWLTSSKQTISKHQTPGFELQSVPLDSDLEPPAESVPSRDVKRAADTALWNGRRDCREQISRGTLFFDRTTDKWIDDIRCETRGSYERQRARERERG